jgi:hypothetical protein
MNAHAVAFPTEHEEVVAMATTMDIPPEVVFIQNGCSEFSIMFGEDPEITSDPKIINDPPMYTTLFSKAERGSELKAKSSNETIPRRNVRDHCSDLGLIYKDTANNNQPRIIQGHNEDWWSTVAGIMSIIHTPDWWGYIYPGQLPGTSFVVNRHGLSLSMNSLWPLVPGYSAQSGTDGHGVSYLFSYALRSIVNARSTEEVTAQLAKYPIYSGYSLNVMSACDTSLTNIEGYGNTLGVTTRIGAEQAGPQPHFNNYLSLNVKQDTSEGTSVGRMDCFAHSTFHNREDVRNFLGNLTCPVFFTESNGMDESETLSTWIVDPQEKKCSMYRLPVDCDVSQSRCYSQDVPNPKVISWDFTCKK